MFIVMKAGREVDRAKCITVIGSMNYFLHDMCLAAEQWPIFSFLFCLLDRYCGQALWCLSCPNISFSVLITVLMLCPFSPVLVFFFFFFLYKT